MAMHCLPGSESLASSYVDGKNRQRVFGVLTVECRVDIFVSVRKKGPWVNRVRPDSLSALSLKGAFSIYIEYLSDRTDTVGCILGGHRQFDRRVTYPGARSQGIALGKVNAYRDCMLLVPPKEGFHFSAV